jgi:two-component system chemotaxis response regulator CheB
VIRVLVVDDSPTVRNRLVEILRADPEFEVVGEAGDGRRAVELAVKLRPDVITLDMVLPGMNGLAATEQIMAHAPTPILVVSASFNRGELFDTYEALAAGAVDVLDKLGAGGTDADDEAWVARFRAAVRMVSKIKVITHPRGRLQGLARPPAGALAGTTGDRRPELVAIGASTGGPAALCDVLGAIPTSFPLPIVIVLHIGAMFAAGFADWLGRQTQRTVTFAADGDVLDAAVGRVLLAPPDRHVVIRSHRVQLSTAPARHHCKPSVDVLFESLALDYGARAAGCLLTGMGRDGATGLFEMRRAGAFTIAQDEATSVVYGMPREAALCGAAERVLPLPEIGPMIASLAARAAGEPR